LNSKVTIEYQGRRKKKLRADVLCQTLVKDALDPKNTAGERRQAIEAIMNRMEGKPVQPIGVTPDTEVHLTISSTENKL
jgi:hypothetical protein